MKSKVLTLAALAVSMTSSLQATKLYDDGTKTLDISGRVKGMFTTGRGNENMNYNNGSSRIRLSGTTALENGVTLFGATEWGYNAAATSQDAPSFISHRLSYAGAKTENHSISMGRQWSVFYNVAAYTDVYEYAGGEANLTYSDGDSGGYSGLGRANDTVKYEGGFGNLHLGLMVQGQRESKMDNGLQRDYGVGTSIEYKTENVNIGIASQLTRNDVTDQYAMRRDDLETTSTVVGASAFLLDRRIYLAASSSLHTNIVSDSYLNGLADQAIGVETMISFFYDTELLSGFYAGMNHLMADYNDPATELSTNGTALSYVEVGARHVFMPNAFVYMAYKHDLRGEEDLIAYTNSGKADNVFAVGARYEF